MLRVQKLNEALIVESSADQKVEVFSVSPAELLKQHKQEMLRKQRARLGTPTAPPLELAPKLGRGGATGGFVSLDMSKKGKPISKTELAKVRNPSINVYFVSSREHIGLKASIKDICLYGKYVQVNSIPFLPQNYLPLGWGS